MGFRAGAPQGTGGLGCAQELGDLQGGTDPFLSLSLGICSTVRVGPHVCVCACVHVRTCIRDST